MIPAPPGTERKDYLAVARAEHADYYIAGFLSPLAEGVSVVEQVVSTTSGIEGICCAATFMLGHLGLTGGAETFD